MKGQLRNHLTLKVFTQTELALTQISFKCLSEIVLTGILKSTFVISQSLMMLKRPFKKLFFSQF